MRKSRLNIKKLEQAHIVWITKQANKLLIKECNQLKESGEKYVSKARLVNNLIIEKYGNIGF